MGTDVFDVERAADHGFQPIVVGVAFRDVELDVAQIADARREAEAQQVHQRENVIGETCRVGVGLEVTKHLGRKGGRNPKITERKIDLAKKLLARGVPPKEMLKNLSVSIPTLYRWVPASAHA